VRHFVPRWTHGPQRADHCRHENNPAAVSGGPISRSRKIGIKNAKAGQSPAFARNSPYRISPFYRVTAVRQEYSYEVAYDARLRKIGSPRLLA
jgi:hypothetical protein